MINPSLYFYPHFFFPKEIFSACPVKFLYLCRVYPVKCIWYLCRAYPVKPCFTRVISIPLCHSRESGNLSFFVITRSFSDQSTLILHSVFSSLNTNDYSLFLPTSYLLINSIPDTIYCFPSRDCYPHLFAIFFLHLFFVFSY